MKAIVKYNGTPAGILEKTAREYTFQYEQEYILAGGRPISITMPFNKNPFKSKYLFPVLMNLLSEGSNKKMQCRLLKIAEDDYFSLLLATANQETIGPLTVEPLQNEAE
ncbi:MAG TPA: HipA N-terminal domain-containing protein [Sediminibacterium sp.]|nr:HipA N-terminal domain-containing protein [Sediminibacterium sp.]